MGKFWDTLVLDVIGNTNSEAYWRAIQRRHAKMFGSTVIPDIEEDETADEVKEGETVSIDDSGEIFGQMISLIDKIVKSPLFSQPGFVFKCAGEEVPDDEFYHDEDPNLA